MSSNDPEALEINPSSITDFLNHKHSLVAFEATIYSANVVEFAIVFI
jgi:hypothetical protein